MLWRREREQCPRDSGLQFASLLLHVCPYQRPHLNPKMMYQTTDPHLQLKMMYETTDPHLQFQFQFARAPHGLVQAKCQATCLKIETGCSYQTIWTRAMNMRWKMNQRMQPVSQTLDPQFRRRRRTQDK